MDYAPITVDGDDALGHNRKKTTKKQSMDVIDMTEEIERI